jgi:predicted N-acetyltransferase YhbS
MNLTIRPIGPDDAEVCGRIGYEAHKTISSAHGYPSELASEEYGIEVIKMCLANPNSWGVLAERQDRILGSIFLHRFPPSPVAVIGPLTVHPSAEGGVGKALMEAVLDHASSKGHDHIRLVQSPSHVRSFALYSKCGFILREPLFLMQGRPPGPEYASSKGNVRPVSSEKDFSACNELCRMAHGFSREGELRHAKDQGFASIVERNGKISGYSAGIGIFGHAVAKSNDDLKALIASAQMISGPGFFVPARNHELFVWLLESGFRIAWPASLMTVGPYQEPHAPFIPSLAY